MSYFKKIFTILSKRQKAIVFVISILMFLLTLLELIGLSLVYPLVTVIIDPTKFKELIGEYDKLQFLGAIDTFNLITYVVSGIGIFYVAKILIQIFFNYLKTKFANNLAANIGEMMFNGYLRQPLSFSSEKNSAYILRNIIDLPIQYINNGLVNFIQIFFEFFFIFFAFLLIILANQTIGILILFISTLLIILFILVNKKKISQFGKSINNRIAERLKVTRETIEGLRDINLLKKQDFFKKIFDEHNYKIASLLTSLELKVVLPKFMMELFGISFLLISVIYLINSGYETNEIIPILALIGAGMARVIPSVSRILSFFTRVQATKYSVEIIFSEKKKFENFVKNKDIEYKFEKNILFNKITFGYDQKILIKDFSFNIKKNSMFGIKGKSGSGKTTILNLISGFLEPSKGQIIVDDVQIEKNIENWQKLISYVPQKIFFTDDTIKNNICLGMENSEINQKYLNDAIKLSKADEFINSFPNGIDQNIGEGGKNLSFGQSQRLGLARSLYRKPKLLMLDETTSGLDLDTEKSIIKELVELKKYLTIIIVSHRTETLNYCDQVLDLEKNELL